MPMSAADDAAEQRPQPGTASAPAVVAAAARAAAHLRREVAPALALRGVPEARRVAPAEAWLPEAHDLVALRAGTVTAPGLLARSMEAIGRWEPSIRALLATMEESATRQAEAAQAALDRGEVLGPLHGVPILVKDLVDVAGVPTTAASPLLADNVPAEDAPVIRRLRAAGAVVLAKANTHEFAFGALTPPTRNPWDCERMPGGSSGGSAAGVAAGYATVAVGTDTAGSIREPAALCGLVGLKPTAGLVPTDGVIPLAWSLDAVGPIAATVEDAAAMLRVIADDGPRVGLPRNLGDLRIAVSQELLDPLQAPVAAAFSTVLDELDGAGARISHVRLADPDELLGACLVVLGAEALSYHRRWLRERRAAYGTDVLAYLELSEGFTAADYVDAQRLREVLNRRVEELLAEHDVLLTPAQSVLAPRIADELVTFPGGRTGPRDLNLIRPLAPFNLTGSPAASVPVRRVGDLPRADRPSGVPEGLAVSVQMVGPAGSDLALLRLGGLLQALVGWVPAAPHPPGASHPTA
jgi:aspartyl-tRNA(Asn)/glutamyl-tRNA(Gln) amidotransferase subunit A